MLDYDAQGNLVGIDIDNASKKVQLKELIPSKLLSEVRTVAANQVVMFADMYSVYKSDNKSVPVFRPESCTGKRLVSTRRSHAPT